MSDPCVSLSHSLPPELRGDFSGFGILLYYRFPIFQTSPSWLLVHSSPFTIYKLPVPVDLPATVFLRSSPFLPISQGSVFTQPSIS